MNLTTISDASRAFGISTRTLRYWEQIGLIESHRDIDYAYRTYDERAMLRLRQILALRRLRVPLKQVETVLRDGSVDALLTVLIRHSGDLNGQVEALDTVRCVVNELIARLKTHRAANGLDVLDDDGVVKLLALLPLSNTQREDRPMDNLNKANDTLNMLTDVRILTLPPATVAASHYVGDEPEFHAGKALDTWVLESGLLDHKPDCRHYGFNHPNPVDETSFHGYEMWVTIPDDFDVPAPLMKKQFAGGLYAAHVIQMGNFHEWEWLFHWARVNGKYEFAGDMADDGHMFGLLEEHLNYGNHVRRGQIPAEPPDMQLDLLMPVREIG